MNNLLPVILFCLSSSLTPGPNNFMLMNSGLNFGIKRSLPHFFGICLGFPLMVLTIALGFGAVFTHYTWLKDVLKIVGSVYMLYLAWQVVKSSLSDDGEDEAAKPFSFMQAAIFQWVNPKAWLMTVGAISIFTVSANYYNNAMGLTLIFFLMVVPSIGVWLFFGAFLQKVLKNRKQQKMFNLLMAFCLVASILLIFVE